MQERPLDDFFSLLAENARGFFVLFFLLVGEYTQILLQLLKKGAGTLPAYENLSELPIGF